MTSLTILLTATLALGQQRADVVVADFEGEDHGAWVTTGAAFGKGPARGTLPGQMEVTGFLGKGLVNSFHGGDDALGILTSPPFRIERSYLSFLIGGGGHAGGTCIELLRDDEVIRASTGHNTRPGGSERLEWASWDVSDLVGQTARIRIADRRKGGWGHINVDQIVQSDQKRGLAAMSRSLVAAHRYLVLPVANDAPIRKVRVAVGDVTAREFDIRLAGDGVDFWVSADLLPWVGKEIRVEAMLPSDSTTLSRLETRVEPPGLAEGHRESERPGFHFTSRRGWLNDPNGLVFHDGEYHLFYQHNPYGWDWGNMHWGHAVSRDLVRWIELGDALHPRSHGDWCFSGSAVVDTANTSGFGQAGRPPLVAAFTSTGRGECIVFSNDRGRSWKEFPGNPVLEHQGRDPRLLWHEPTRRWVMAVYDEVGKDQSIAFHSSPDLKTWTLQSKIPGYFECPDLFELPVSGRPGETRWVLHAADGAYALGEFDGSRFVPEGPGKHVLWHGNFYAAQSFTDAPNGRRIQIGWGRDITFRGMPFNQQMVIPCDLRLEPTPEGIRMFAWPVPEVESLRAGKVQRLRDVRLAPGASRAIEIGDFVDFELTTEVEPRSVLAIDARGVTVRYDSARGVVECAGVKAPLTPAANRVSLRLLIDRGSIEVFGNRGRVAISRAAKFAAGDRQLRLTCSEAPLAINELTAHELESAWSSRVTSGPAASDR